MPRFLLTLFNRREYLLELNTGTKSEISDSNTDSANFTPILGIKYRIQRRSNVRGRDSVPLREGLLYS